jgi:GT2 family glycosyltransferase
MVRRRPIERFRFTQPQGTDLLDIVIVNYESTDYLIRCLESLYTSVEDIPVNVFVQDNNSTDGLERVRAGFPQVHLTKNIRNLGFAKAVNRSLTQCNAPFTLLLNPDTMAVNGCFESVLTYMRKHPDVGIVGPRILDADGSTQGSARSFPNFVTALFGRNSILTRFWPNNPISRTSILNSKSDGRNPMEVDWVSGACMIVRKEARNEVGALDDRFFVYWEDVDWCKRMWERGWRVVYFPAATIVHNIGGSSGKKPIRSILEFHKSCYRFIKKHGNGFLKLMNPVIIGALAIRLTVAVLLNRLGRWSGRLLFREEKQPP